jgi:uncharacterized metal-binding protein YceD (DUF177 family)
MDIDLTKLITNNLDVINIRVDVSFDEEQLKRANIRCLKDTVFNGKVRKLYDDEYELEGNINGVMVLSDDITLEDVDYKFDISILESFNDLDENLDNNLKIINNKLDISEYLWQNIVLEVPSKIVSDKNKDIKLEGNGWRLVTEEELEEEKKNESPFSELDNKF